MKPVPGRPSRAVKRGGKGELVEGDVLPRRVVHAAPWVTRRSVSKVSCARAPKGEGIRLGRGQIRKGTTRDRAAGGLCGKEGNRPKERCRRYTNWVSQPGSTCFLRSTEDQLVADTPKNFLTNEN